MADEFLQEPQAQEGTEQTPEPEKIKLGEAEYTQEELNELVKLGGIAKEYEEKWDRKVDTIYPKYLEATRKLSELEKQIEEQKTEAPTVEPGSPDEVKKQAISQAKELGLVTVEDINNYIDARIQGVQLREDIKGLIDDAKEKGTPVPNEEDLLNYMAESGVRNPEKAYKLMYEEQLDSWKEEQLKKIKPEGLKTQPQSTAGNTKMPEPKIATNKEELAAQLRAYLQGQGGNEGA